MTVSTHVYEVFLIGSPDVELSLRGGSISLDEGRAPHVQGSIEIARPSLSTLTALDPRDGKRIRVVATVTSPSFPTTTRTFNLGLRDRQMRALSSTVTLSLASDEALLSDYAPLVDDDGAFTHQSSLRDVIDYVLDKIGATLASSPSGDTTVRTYSDATNLIANPAARVDLTGWSSVGLASMARNTGITPMANGANTAIRLNGNASESASYVEYQAVSASSVAGRTFRLHARQVNGAAPVTGTADTNARRAVVYYSINGGLSYVQAARSAAGSSAADAVTDHNLTVSFPYGTNAVIIRLFHGVETVQVMYWSDVLFTEYSGDPTDNGYFDGSTTDTSSYTYAWSDDVNESASTRTALIDRPTDSLKWRAGEDALSFLRPIVQAAGYRLVCNESRTWTLRNENYYATGAISVRASVNLMDAADTISRDSGLWFDAQVTRYTWTDASGVTKTKSDYFTLTTPPTRVNLVEISAAYPGPGRSEYAVRRAQGRGRDVSVTAVADWKARAEQPCTFVLSGAPTQVGKTSSVTFNLDRDEMTVTSRTTDTPFGAIDLLVGTINSLTGTINAL